MCGIVGELMFRSGSKTCEESIARLSALMARRGPDDSGQWSDGQRCSFGFRRLSILDLSPAGHQPMVTPDGRYVLVFNGEVYNFAEIRQELTRDGIDFRSTGDTEVVLHALARWGNAALSKFNGMFALAFYDSRERRLLLARDHAGIKPLYYLLTSQILVFGSQYDQLLAHPASRSLPVSQSALALYLHLSYIPAPYALLEHTHMLQPGSWLEVTAEGRIRQGTYFEFPMNSVPDLHGSEAQEAVDAAITNAVRRQMISDVPIGAFLSGGIDSPLVTAKMQARAANPLPAFTMSVSGDEMDEAPDAREYAHELGVRHVEELMTPEVALATIDDAVSACGEPFADYSIFPTLLVSKMGRREVKVMLSGDGGDELFWGYFGRFASVLQVAQDYRRSYGVRSLRRGAKKLLNLGNGHKNLRWSSLGEWYRAKHTRIPADRLRSICPDVAEWPAACDLFDYRGWRTDETAQWLRWNEFVGHLTMVLLKVDRASMFHSLEVRVPLLDREVIDVATRLDWRTCLDIRRGLGKLPLRRALSQHARHQSTVKRGFAVPMNAWLRGPLRPMFEGMVLDRSDILGVPINRGALRSMFDAHLTERADIAWGLWTLLSLALWEEKHYLPRRSGAPSIGTV